MSGQRRLAMRMRALALGALVLAVPAAASAEAPQRVNLRGTIESLDGTTLHLKSRDGKPVTVALADNYAVRVTAKTNVAAIKPNDYIAVAGVPQSDGAIKAQVVQIFPEAMRGIAEGHFPWDLTPNSTMTNATVEAVVAKAADRVITLKYKGGEKTVVVPPEAPVVTLKPGSRDMLKPGIPVFLVAVKDQAGLKAGGVAVGENGSAPPN
jgi:hypothetical protein